ncbi:hypothetical protein Acr_00g0074140 [Actinidia rufa]|uniref:Uncharacterized protein n=1 Tax=Actinidia rufa TaxID=165716 RepID=A0A7J0DSE5_9ERIC|nr:hypothetical protein Acr_00g0074140 [Actinidia rufa]
MESRAKRSQCNHQAAKYERRSRGFWSKTRRMPDADSTANVGDVVEMESKVISSLEWMARWRRVASLLRRREIGDVNPLVDDLQRCAYFKDFYPSLVAPTRDAKFALVISPLFKPFNSKWLYFKARLKKNLFRGTPTMLRGGRRNSSSSRETTKSSPEEYPRILGFLGSRGRGTPQRSNVLPVLNEVEQERFDQIFGKMTSSNGNNGEKKLVGDAAHVAANEGESHHFRDDPPRGDHSRDGSDEYIGTIRKEMRKVLTCLPNLTLLRLLGGKSGILFLVWNQVARALTRKPAMLKKIDMKRLALMAKRATSAAKCVVIGEKRPRDETLDISPLKKGKQATNTKKKGPISPPEEKKKGLAAKIGRLHPELDIQDLQIDDELAEEEEGEEKSEEEKGEEGELDDSLMYSFFFFGTRSM